MPSSTVRKGTAGLPGVPGRLSRPGSGLTCFHRQRAATFKFFRREVKNHPFAWDDGQSNNSIPDDNGHADWVSSVALLLNDGGLIQVRALSTGRVIKSFGLYATLNGVALSPDGKTSMLGGETPELWDVVRGRLLRRLPKQPNSVEAVAFSPDGKIVASESQVGISPFAPGVIKLWDVTTGRELNQLSGHRNRVSALVFSPGGRWLASGSWDHTVKLWDVSGGREVRGFPPAN